MYNCVTLSFKVTWRVTHQNHFMKLASFLEEGGGGLQVGCCAGLSQCRDQIRLFRLALVNLAGRRSGLRQR